MRVDVSVALLHHPVLDRSGRLVTTAVTNLDIHDIARSARTYGVKRFFIVTPVVDQHELVGRILSHWSSESSRQYHPDRVEAVRLARLAKDFAEVRRQVEAESGRPPEVVLTSAKPRPRSVSAAGYRREIESGEPRSVILVFGTGWGVASVFEAEVDRVLDPILGPEGPDGYHHLSVRAAAAITLHELFGGTTR